MALPAPARLPTRLLLVPLIARRCGNEAVFAAGSPEREINLRGIVVLWCTSRNGTSASRLRTGIRPSEAANSQGCLSGVQLMTAIIISRFFRNRGVLSVANFSACVICELSGPYPGPPDARCYVLSGAQR